MCDNCGPFLQLLESYEEQVRKNGMNERPVLSHQQVEVLANYVHTWPQRQCFCGFRDAKNFERFNLVLQSVICLSVLQLKAIKLEGRIRSEKGPDEQSSLNGDGWGLERRVQLLGLLAKMFLNSFPLYLAYKHCGQPKMDEMSQQEVATLSTFCELSDPELPLYLLRYVCLFCKSGGIFAMAECFEEGVQLEVGVAQAIIAIVCNLKVWLNYRSVAQLFVPLRSRVLRYLCNLPDKDLRLPAVKNMSDFMWAFMKDPTESGVQFDREGLDLAFKYFTSSTLTMRLAGIAHINVHINLYNELCNSETVSELYGQNLANWLIDNNIIAHIFGPNLHVEVIKQSQLVLSFLAMEGRLSNEHLDTIWTAAQLKHCSRQVHDLLPPLIKHLEARPVLHLYRLLCRLEPKDHTEQSLFLASALIKFIWSSSSSEALLKALPAQRRPQSSSENSVSMDGSDEEESEDGRKTPSTASEEAKRPSTDSSTASSMRPASRRGIMLPQRPQKAPSESDEEKKMVTDFMMVEDDEEDEEHSQASSSGGCLPSMLGHEAIVVTPEECASFPHRSLVESEDGSYSSRMSNKSEKNMADFEGEESGCEEEELSQLAAQAHFGAMSNIFQSRFHSRAGSLLEASRVFAQFSVENVCKPGNTLLWDLLQDDTIGQLGEGLALEAEKALCNLLCYNIDRYIRLKFIEGCLDNLEKNRSVVVSLRLLPKLLQSFQQFRSSVEIQHTTMWAEQEHHMMPHFFSNLVLFTKHGPRHPNLFSHQIEVQVRLNFLTSVYSAPITPENFRLSSEQVDVLWSCLTEDGQCSDELASWLLSQARSTGGQGPPELHALSFDALRHLYLNKLPSLQPETISMVSLSLFQQLCNLARLAASQPNSPLKGVDSIGMQHLWKVALRAKNTDVSMAAIQYLNSFYVGRQLEQESEFVEQCMSHLEMATNELAASQELSLTYIQRAVLLLRTHLEIFRRRYAYHLRRWYLEGQGVVSHITHAGEGSPLRVVVQPAGVPDKSTLELQTTDLVAELRAEVAHWYEGLQARSLLAPTSAQSTPVLGSLLAEGPIRIITQGQELNTDFDEKTLQEMGFKDNQLIFISMGASRPNKKRDEAASLLPPPPRDSLPTLLLLQPKYFDQLFGLLHTLSSLQCGEGNLKAQMLSRRVWEILTLLPTSPTLLKGFQELGTSSDNELATLLDPASPQKLMYSLYIAESLSKAFQFKRQKMLEEESASGEGVSWSQRFIRTGGLKHLFAILMSGVLQKGVQDVGEWQQDCLAQLLKLLCQLGISVLEEPSGEEAEARRKNKRPANRLVDRLVVHRLNEAMLQLMDVDSTMARLNSILLEASRDVNKTGFWGRTQVVHFAMALLVSWVHSSNEARECLFGSVDFQEWLRCLVLEDPEPSVRREVCAALCRMCLCSGSSSADITAPLLAQLLLFLPAAQRIRPTQLDEIEEGKEHYGPASKDYFWLLCHLLDSLSEDFVKESLDGGCTIDLEGLAVRVAEAIVMREYLEGRLLEDEGLVGLLNLACNIVKHDPPFKTSDQGQTFLLQVFEFLFSLPDPSKRYLPKCKSILARNAAYDLLVEMCRRAPKNYSIIHSKLLEQHQPSKKMDRGLINQENSVSGLAESAMDQEGSYPWDYWPHEDGRADCGYVGLTNLGATCYMASCMQHLYMMPQARNALLQAKIDSAGKHKQTLVEMQRMFAYLLESERKAYNPRSFCKVYQMDHQPLNTGEQKDMAEFFIDLVSKLEEMTPELKKLVKTLFCGVLSNNFVSLDCNHVSRNVEEFYTVRCQVADMRNLYESLDEVTVKDTLEGDNMYTCSQCSKKVRAEKRACFKKLPHILCFNTMRYTFNMLTMLKEKVNTHFSFPLRLDMSGYVEKHLMPQHYQDEKNKAKQDGEEEHITNGDQESYEYNLIGVTVHTGTADGGHYYSFIKDRTKDKWFLFNDAEIKPFDSNQLATECFGGEMTSKTYDSVTDKFLDFSFEKTNSAYMLFYEWANNNHEPEPSTSMLSKDLEDWIWKDNRNFLRDKNIFEHTYFNFMWQMCSYVPQSLSSGALSEDKLAELTASFFLETFVHAKEKPLLVQWVDLLSRQLCNSEVAGEWFLSHMAKDYWWPLEIFIKCPSQMVRQTFQRLCLQIISKLRPQHSPLYLKTDTEGPDSSCVTRFIGMLLSLLDPGAKTYIRHLTEYFGFLYEFSKLGEEECQFLISVNAINSFVYFLVGPLDAAGEMVSLSEEDEEDEIVTLPTDKYKPTSLEKMITLVATLVEKSRGEDQRLQISQADLTAITGGKGFPFLYLQIKDSINLQQTRNLIFALTRYNERLALQIVAMIFTAINKHSESAVIEKLSPACQPFFKLLSLLTDTSGGGPSGLPCFSQLILNRIWEAAEQCPQSTLEWLAIQVPRNKMVAAWVLESIDKWVEPYLIAHNNNRVRHAAASLLVALVPNPNFKNVYRHPRNLMHSNREFTMTPEATQVQHKIYILLLGLMKPARQYIDASVHGTTKLGAFFALLTHFATSRTEKLMFGPFFMELWQIFHPKLSEPAISINQNKQALLHFWSHVLIDCRENVNLILQDPTVIKNIAFNYILADHDDQELLLFNRHMLPPYYGILRLCCQESRSFTRHLASHQNIQWAFKNITPYHMHYPDAVDELFKLMQLFVMKYPDSTEQEIQDINAFKRSTIQLYLQTIEGRNNWSTLVAALRILLDCDDDRIFLVYQGGLGNLFEGFIALHMMYHEATACHVGGDLMELLSIVRDSLRTIRVIRENKEMNLNLSLNIKDLPESLRRLATLLNTYNPAELRQMAINILQEMLLLQPTETLQLLVPLLTHCHMAYQETHNNACPLGPYFPRRGQKMPASFKINVRPQRPMVQMIIPHAQISIAKVGPEEEFDKALAEFYLPYHRLIDLMVRVGLSCDLASEPLVNLSAIIGYEAVPLHFTLFPQLWTEAIKAVSQLSQSNHEDSKDAEQSEKNGQICKIVPKLIDLRNLKSVDQKYVDMLIQNTYLVEYLEAVLLDERTSLNQTPIYEFVSTFLPKVKGQVLGEQTRVLISKLVDELVSVSSTMDLLAQSQALNGDLRALIVAFNSDRSLPISDALSTALEVILARLHSLTEKLSENKTIQEDEAPPKKLRLESSGSGGANGLEAVPLTNGGAVGEEVGTEAASLAWLQTFEKTVTELREAVSCDSPP